MAGDGETLGVGDNIWGSVINAAGSYLGAQYGQAQAGGTSDKLSSKTSAWAQLLGLSTIGQFKGTMQAANQKLIGGYQGAANAAGQLPGIAQSGMQAQLGQLQGAEQGAISHVLKAQKAQAGGVQQAGTSSGFYGGSTQQGAQAQVQSNTSQSISDIMAGTAGAKAGIIGQGTAAMAAGVAAAGQSQAALGEAYAKAAGGEYNLMKDKLNTILATANSWGIGDWEQKNLMIMAGGLAGAGQTQYKQNITIGPGGSFGPETSAAFDSKNWKVQQWAQNWNPWSESAQPWLKYVWN